MKVIYTHLHCQKKQEAPQVGEEDVRRKKDICVSKTAKITCELPNTVCSMFTVTRKERPTQNG